MRRIELAPQARLDLEDIAHFGIVSFGYAQAEAYQDGLIQQFELLAVHSRIGLGLEEREGAHRFGYGSHVIFFTLDADVLIVRRVLHGRMDVLRHL